MVDGRFNCQLAYDGSPFQQMVNGKVVPVYDGNDISRFVYEKRPSLKGKAVTIEFATQKVFAR
jgi:hypothetical protein